MQLHRNLNYLIHVRLVWSIGILVAVHLQAKHLSCYPTIVWKHSRIT